MVEKQTIEKLREEFLKQIWQYIDYYERIKPIVEHGKEDYTTRERMEKLAFSILSMLDGGGGSFDLPPFMVAPIVSKEDKQFYKEELEVYYPVTNYKNVKLDIGGSLHELFYYHSPNKEKTDNK